MSIQPALLVLSKCRKAVLAFYNTIIVVEARIFGIRG